MKEVDYSQQFGQGMVRVGINILTIEARGIVISG